MQKKDADASSNLKCTIVFTKIGNFSVYTPAE